jgi:hypothetical protein
MILAYIYNRVIPFENKYRYLIYFSSFDINCFVGAYLVQMPYTAAMGAAAPIEKTTV